MICCAARSDICRKLGNSASVSGFYFSHPDSTYFSVGKIGTDQVEDMVKRRGVAKEDVERALAPNL